MSNGRILCELSFVDVDAGLRILVICCITQPQLILISNMSVSGIGVSPELTEVFAEAVNTKDIRFLKVSINKGMLSPII